MFGRKHKNDVVLEVNAAELRMMRNSLLELRSRLIREGHYTDAVDDLLIKLCR